MAKRRAAPPPDRGAVPPELADPDDPVWGDPRAAEALAIAYRLEPRWSPFPRSALRDPAFERFKTFRRAWASDVGMVTEWGGLDWRKLRAAGVFAGSRGPRMRSQHGTADLGARRLIVDD